LAPSHVAQRRQEKTAPDRDCRARGRRRRRTAARQPRWRAASRPAGTPRIERWRTRPSPSHRGAAPLEAGRRRDDREGQGGGRPPKRPARIRPQQRRQAVARPPIAVPTTRPSMADAERRRRSNRSRKNEPIRPETAAAAVVAAADQAELRRRDASAAAKSGPIGITITKSRMLTNCTAATSRTTARSRCSGVRMAALFRCRPLRAGFRPASITARARSGRSAACGRTCPRTGWPCRRTCTCRRGPASAARRRRRGGRGACAGS